MHKVTLAQLKQLALQAKNDLWTLARTNGRDVKVYLHWSAGHYGQFFSDYHINIDKDGSVYMSTNDLATVLAHTWHRNSGAIGVSLAACYGATTANWGAEPPTIEQVEAMAQVACVLAEALDLTIDAARIMTHAEAANEDGYGPQQTWERWDLWMLPGVPAGEGGNVIRGKANWYRQNGI